MDIGIHEPLGGEILLLLNGEIRYPIFRRVILTVEQGTRQTLTRSIVRGNALTDDRVIRREIGLQPGDPVSRQSMLETQRKLYSLGIFRTVDVKTAPDGDANGQAKMQVDVVEGAPLLTSFGAGYNSEQGLQGFVQIGHNNIFGSARSANLLLNASGVTQRAQLSVLDRRLFGIPFDGLATVFWEAQERESFNLRRTGGSVQLSRKLTKQVTALGRYTLEDEDLSDVEILDPGSDEAREIADSDLRLANIAGSIAVDRRDDILAPTRGIFASADVRFYLAPIGSQEQFTRTYGSISGFRPLGDSIVLAGALRFGAARPLARHGGNSP